jgi:hypothetical protein
VRLPAADTNDMMRMDTPHLEDDSNMTMTEHRALEDRYPIPDGMTGIMHHLNRQGDVPIMWNKNNPDEVELARNAFDTARKNGFVIFRSEGKDGHRGEVVHEFNPADQRLIMVKRPEGG